MKNKDIISSFVGAGFFAAGLLGLSLSLPVSLVLGGVSFVASELIVNGKEKKDIEKRELTFKEQIQESRKNNKHIKEVINNIENVDVKKDLDEINISTTKIIDFIEKNSLQNKTSMKFLEYYLPVCVKIVDRYDEIENQKLTSNDSKKFMEDGKRIINDTNKAFKKILNS